MKELPPEVEFLVHGVAPGSKSVVKKVTADVSDFVALGVNVTEFPTQVEMVEGVIDTFLGVGRKFIANELDETLVEAGQASALGVNTKEMVFAVVKVSVTKLEELVPTATPFTLQE